MGNKGKFQAKLTTRKILAKGKKFEEEKEEKEKEAREPEAFAVEISCIQATFSKLFSRI